VFHVEILIEQSPPQDHALAGEIGIHFIGHALHGEVRIRADTAPFRLSGEGAKPLPGTHRANPGLRQMLQPVLQSGMGFAPVCLPIVVGEIAMQPKLTTYQFLITGQTW
jgi:hypothetical protein